MSSKTVAVPKYRRHKGSGQAFVQVKGRRHYLGKWDSPRSKERYAAFVAELAVSPSTTEPLPLTTPASQFSVVELIAAYVDYAAGYYQRNGQPTRSLDNVKLALKVIKNLYGLEPVATFSSLNLLAIQNHLAAEGSTRAYVNKQVGIIKRMFKWGVSRMIVPPTVHTALSTVEGLRKGRSAARESKPVLPVPDDLVDATLPLLPKVVSDMVRFQRLTGCRPGEVCQLRPCDVDRSGDVWEYRPADHKTVYTKDSYQRAIARAVVRANRERTEAATDMGVEPILLPHWHANQLRHSKATEVRRQFGLEAAQVVLGHAKADVTQIYTERDARLAVEVARKIG